MNATAMLAEQSIMRKYYGRAQQELEERFGSYVSRTDEEIEQLAHALRHQDFMRAIEPYQRMRTSIISPWLLLRSRPGDCAHLPATLQQALANVDEMIAGVAREFGYQADTGTKL
jgi:hypothetical protein